MGKFYQHLQSWFCANSCVWFRQGLVGVTFLGLSLTLSSRFFWEPTLKVGMVVQEDIRVPRDITIEDPEATYTARQKAQQEVLPIYKIDEDANVQARQRLEQLILQGDLLRDKAGRLPYLPLEDLSLEQQRLLRQMSDQTWQALLSGASSQPALSRKLQEIQQHSPQKWRMILQARQSYRQVLMQLGGKFYTRQWLQLSDMEWELDKYILRESLEQLLSEGIVPGIPLELMQRRLQSLRLLPKEEERRGVVLALLQEVSKPNLVPDYGAMAREAAKAAEAVPPQLITLKQGQILILAGQTITNRDFIFLDQLGLTRRRPNWVRIITVAGLVGLGLLVFSSLFYKPRSTKNRDLAVIALTTLGITVTTVLIPNTYLMFVPLAGLGFILGSFYGARLATSTTLLVCLPVLASLAGNWLSYIPLVVGAVVAGMITDRPQTRSHLALMGLVVGAVQGGVYLLLTMAGGAPIGLVVTALQFAAGGVVSSIIALGAIPYLEQIAYTLTPIRLAELANLDRPLLRRLVNEAPGTFQHTLFVANLAEAGARALGADTNLVRTGTLYHDIGKTLHPEFFIENQMGGTNPHDRLDDPWRSAAIIKEHVTGGLKLAQRYRLPEILQAFIPEHQGTIVISYFYHRAKAIDPQAREADFRYDGPTPQSRETGIVMLADACEAALRSLGTDTTLEKAQEMVMRIFQARWDDGQLRQSGLTWQDLETLAPVFITVWQQRNHGRIKYPELAKKIDPTGSAIPDSQYPLATREK
ncbi:MAG: HDIG domain-containing protein [Pseudanabaenaceae cyanobacterium SKYGB_i_bin29]|nr:HDIG domain-containing protein [Pseudanabaenaceae cyanobacterium SKYG29]MDW8421623.1 HDIG domain-containing protein [Pseudanabaenaceae cyanobacterium SKYGB_i_bin29]